MSDMQGTKEPPKTKLEILKFVGLMFVLAAVMIGSGELIATTLILIGGFVYSVSLIPQALTVLYRMYTDPKELRSRGLGRILMLVSIFGTIMLVQTVLYLEYGQ